MFGNLKDRLYSLQDDIATSVKNLAPVNVQTGQVIWPSTTAGSQLEGKNLQAGGELLEHWQSCWEDIHLANERNIKKANRCEKMVSDINTKTCCQWSQLMTVQTLVSQQVPLISVEIQTAMSRLAEMESLFQEVEVSLLALEESVEAREMQEKQLEERFQLAVYQEKKRAAFNDLSSQLQAQFECKRDEVERRKQREKQSMYQTLFERDMEAHLATANTASKSHDDKSPSSSSDGNFLRLPKLLHDPDASLETVDLNDDPDDQALEKFLKDEDLLYDISPLPRDDYPDNRLIEEDIQKEDKEDVKSNETQPKTDEGRRDLNSQPLDKTNNSAAAAVTLSVPAVTMTSSESVAESLYFTPDTSANEKLSDLAN